KHDHGLYGKSCGDAFLYELYPLPVPQVETSARTLELSARATCKNRQRRRMLLNVEDAKQWTPELLKKPVFYTDIHFWESIEKGTMNQLRLKQETDFTS